MTQHGSRRAIRRFRTFMTEIRQANLLRQIPHTSSDIVEPSHQFAKQHSLYHSQPGWRRDVNPRRNPAQKGSAKLTHQELRAMEKERAELASL